MSHISEICIVAETAVFTKQMELSRMSDHSVKSETSGVNCSGKHADLSLAGLCFQPGLCLVGTLYIIMPFNSFHNHYVPFTRYDTCSKKWPPA